MDQDPAGRSRAWGPATATLALGLAAGWLAGRRSVETPPVPPPKAWVNPLADTRVGEVLRHRYTNGVVDTYEVLEVMEDSILVAVTKEVPGGGGGTRQLRVSRNFPGAFIILSGDVDPESVTAGFRDFYVSRMVPETVTVKGRTHAAWRIEGRHRHLQLLTYWVDPEMPVHGVIRLESPRGVVLEVDE